MSAPDVLDDDDTSDNVETRFGIETLDVDERKGTTTMSMPIAHLLNPFTGEATFAPLAIMVDDACGMGSLHRRGPDEWPVTSELTFEMSHDAASIIASGPSAPVVATAQVLGRKGTTVLTQCSLTHGDQAIGCGTMRSFFIPAPAEMPAPLVDHLQATTKTTLTELMAAQPMPITDDVRRLAQSPDPILGNAVGTVHGGVATMGLELVASAAMNAGRADTPLRTSSVRVNFLRPFIASGTAHYAGTAVRVGRQSGVADASAISGDGKVCLIARATAYS